MDYNLTILNLTNEKTDLFYGYLCPFVGVIGFCLNVTVFLIFSKAVFKETLYEYMKTQSLFISLDLLITSFRPIHYWVQVSFSRTYVSALYEKFFITYFASVLEISAFVSLVLATLHYYLLIKNVKWLRGTVLMRASYKYVIACVFLFGMVLFLFQIFEYKIECQQQLVIYPSLNNNNSETSSNAHVEYVCDIEYDVFHYNPVKMMLELLAFIIRDGINLLLLIILNVLIFLRAREGIRNKKLILGYLTVKDGQKSKLLSVISRTKYKLTLMVILNSFNCMMGRLPIMVFFIVRNFNESEQVLFFRKLAVLFVYLSYAFNFFFFYFTNKKFHKSLNEHFVYILCCFCFKKAQNSL